MPTRARASQTAMQIYHNQAQLPSSAFICACVAALIFAMPAHGQAPSAVSPNGSRVTATVLARKIWPPGSLHNVRPLVPDEQTYYSLQLRILTSNPLREDLNHTAEAGSNLEAFSEEVIPDTIRGKTICGTIVLTGDTQGLRWLLKDFQIQSLAAPL